MKKLIIYFLSIVFLLLPTCVLANDKIEDEFVKENLNNIKPVQRNSAIQIEDEFAQNYLKGKHNPIIPKNEIVDEFAQNNLKDKKSHVRKNTNYDYTSLEKTVVKINPTQTISSNKKFNEGMELTFTNKYPVKINSVDIPQGSEIIGRIETISPSNFRGIPAQIIIDNFYLKSNPDIYFVGKIDKTGANRLLWVYPSAILLTPFFGTGALMWLIKGGNAKIRKRQTFEIFY